MEIGAKMREKRIEKKITQGQLAALSGVSLSSVKKIENCQRNPKLETVMKIANALELNVNELIYIK